MSFHSASPTIRGGTHPRLDFVEGAGVGRPAGLPTITFNRRGGQDQVQPLAVPAAVGVTALVLSIE